MTTNERKPILLGPGEGRSYDLGTMQATFKADGVETAGRWSISEWRLEPGASGSGAHNHETEDDIFYVLEGTLSLRLGETWRDVGPGTFACAPAGTVHDFENRTDAPARFLNFFVPGGFEEVMPKLVTWFRDNP